MIERPVDFLKLGLGKVVDVAVDLLDDGGGVDGWGHGDHSLSTVAVGEALGVKGDLGNA